MKYLRFIYDGIYDGVSEEIQVEDETDGEYYYTDGFDRYVYVNKSEEGTAFHVVVRDEEPREEPTYVYRLRNKKTGKFHGGGHGTMNGCYSTKKGLRSARKTMARGWYRNEDGDSLEIVTFKLVEVGREDL